MNLSSIINVPPLTKALVSAVIVASIVEQRMTNLFSLLPGSVLFTPWTILTAIFVEENLIVLPFSVIVLLFCGKYLERAWGSKELLKYVVIVGIIANVVTLLGQIVNYYVTGNPNVLYSIPINGMSGVFSAFLVAFKHLVPEHRLAIFGGKVSIRVKNLLGVATVTSVIGLILLNAVVFYNLVNIGWVIGWIYIRFFKYQDGVQGDQSEAFAIQTFFPEFLHPVIIFVSNHVYNLLVKMKCCKPGARTYRDLELGTTAPIPGSARAEAERRRALALKALDMRLSKSPAPAELASNSDDNSALPASDNTNLGNAVIFDADEKTENETDTPKNAL
ncbi:eukaryotic integral membrane protein-domain-containing protein [Sporodiniella umbellata]|nr:eukaryotic integral membrane protein-domain-containing protein [Sporodiniella umbellata]